MLSKEQNLKQMNAMYEANPRILEDVHRAVQGGKEESVFFCLATFKKHVIWSKVVLQRMVIPFDNRNLKQIACGYNVIPRVVNHSLFH